MEQHPVPQNVTTFQFRLVGDMTIKQFGYLASGIIGGYLCYKLPLPFFFTWPLAIGSGLLGFGLAFVPVEERPMDIWIASFFKNVYNPTQWVWQKSPRGQDEKPEPTAIVGNAPGQGARDAALARAPTSASISIVTSVVNFISSFLASIMPLARPGPTAASERPTRPSPEPQQSQTPHAPPASQAILAAHPVRDTLGWFQKLFHGKPTLVPSFPSGFEFADALAAAQAPSTTGKRPDLKEPRSPTVPTSPAAAPPQPVVRTTPSVTTPVAHTAIHDRAVELQGQLSEALAQRERLEKELIEIRQRMERQAKTTTPTPTRQAGVISTMPSAPATSVRVIAPNAATRAGLPQLTTFPNIITGIVKDHYGNLLAGMLITVRDKNDMPLRALKTNRLGQFAASTPLPNGTYVVEIEDPKGVFTFDKAQISVAGAVAPPIEVIAKSQKQVERDRLAREIFGNTQM
ncbi:PrgI family protein [Candidatus Gottesmanbacteria bacterium]|nr:PrgI family protein [Candidatus Gottesmanbacteria bacterium]